MLAIAGIFALRGIFGLLYWSPRRARRSPSGPSPFILYNRLFYSPVCLRIAALVAVSATSVP